MTLIAGTFVSCSWLLAVAWAFLALTAHRGLSGLPDLTLDPPPPPLPPSPDPDLTVIVPACNEEAAIAATLRSLLSSRGLRLQIIAVNDRSTDQTGTEIEIVCGESASSPHSLETLTVKTLPAGWLGKPHAMSLAAARARAPWLLFTDADVLFAPDALARALHHAENRRADHLVIFPTLLVHSLPERAMQATLQVLATWGVRLWRVSDPRSRDFLGVGAFNLVRREVYRAVGGFESLPMEVLEDVRLGWKLKRAGFHPEVALGPGLVSIRWLSGALSVVHLIEKNAFAVSRFQVFLHVLGSLALVTLAVLPAAGFLAGLTLSPWGLAAAGAGCATLLALLLAYRAHRRLTHSPSWLAVLFVPCVAVVAYAFFVSMVLALARGGIVWRGTRYDLKDLRKNAGNW